MERGAAAREKREYMRIHTARRTMLYIVRTLMLVIAGVMVCAFAFFTAARMSNLYILASEGMSLRATCILGGEDRAALEEYFLLACINKDARLNDDRYKNYTISSYNYDLDVENISVAPWSQTATVTAVEIVSIKGAISPDLIEEGKTSADYPVPEWTSGRYKLHFVNNGERWYLSEIELLEERPSVDALRTPDPNQSPLPMATPTPTPAPELITLP